MRIYLRNAYKEEKSLQRLSAVTKQTWTTAKTGQSDQNAHKGDQDRKAHNQAILQINPRSHSYSAPKDLHQKKKTRDMSDKIVVYM